MVYHTRKERARLTIVADPVLIDSAVAVVVLPVATLQAKARTVRGAGTVVDPRVADRSDRTIAGRTAIAARPTTLPLVAVEPDRTVAVRATLCPRRSAAPFIATIATEAADAEHHGGAKRQPEVPHDVPHLPFPPLVRHCRTALQTKTPTKLRLTAQQLLCVLTQRRGHGC